MYTLNNVAKFLEQNQINVVKCIESTDWQVEDDCIILENNLSLQIGSDYIDLWYESRIDEIYRNFGSFKKGKSLAVMIHILLDRHAI